MLSGRQPNNELEEETLDRMYGSEELAVKDILVIF